jgi:[ribosomal protein S5]-alanine N-acetyltransferase
MTPPLETARLLLRPLEIADAGQVQAIFPHWEVVKFLGAQVPWPYPADGVITYYTNVAMPAIARGDECHWSLRLKTAPDQLIGTITLRRGDNNRGFWLGLPWQGLGLMSEAAEAVTDFWFNELGFPVLRVPKAIANTTSRRISQKQGMRVVATLERDFVSGRQPAEIWEITAEEWRHRPNPSR